MARYDFSSRDTRELSLVEGDVVKIYSKMSNGWWRGDIDGRVGASLQAAPQTCSLCSRTTSVYLWIRWPTFLTLYMGNGRFFFAFIFCRTLYDLECAYAAGLYSCG